MWVWHEASLIPLWMPRRQAWLEKAVIDSQTGESQKKKKKKVVRQMLSLRSCSWTSINLKLTHCTGSKETNFLTGAPQVIIIRCPLFLYVQKNSEAVLNCGWLTRCANLLQWLPVTGMRDGIIWGHCVAVVHVKLFSKAVHNDQD